jgi:glycosyltransferase involved in cell wall biosynthesis
MSGPTVILISGRDPQRYFDCAHCGYVRIHAYAATLAGYDVHVLCLDRNERVEATSYGTVHAVKTKFRMVRQNMVPLHSPVLAQAVEQLATTFGPTPIIIHGFGVWGHTAVHACRRLKNRGMRCVSLVSSYTTYLDESMSQWRGLIPENGPLIAAKTALEQAWISAVISRYELDGYRNADRILVNYRTVEKLIKFRFGADLRCDVIPCTIEREFERQQSDACRTSLARNSPPVILSIARHNPRKGIDVLLHALQITKQSGCLFSAHLVGGGPLLDTHRRLLERLQLSDCITIHGRVSRVDDYLDNADIFVLPSREEQSGSLALLEAMRAGVACVASGCDGIPEDVTHKREAWLTVPGDAASLAEGIVSLVKDKSLRERLALAGQKTFEHRFSGVAFVKVLGGLYRELVENDRNHCRWDDGESALNASDRAPFQVPMAARLN